MQCIPILIRYFFLGITMPNFIFFDFLILHFLIFMPLLLFTDPPEIEIEQNWYEREGLVEVELICVVHAKPPAEVSREWQKNCISINLY